MHLSTAKSLLCQNSESCRYADHHSNGDIKNLFTLHHSHEETVHATSHVLRATISPLKGVIRNMKMIIYHGACLQLALSSYAWELRLDTFPF